MNLLRRKYLEVNVVKTIEIFVVKFSYHKGPKVFTKEELEMEESFFLALFE
jgi:hypothetical protein